MAIFKRQEQGEGSTSAAPSPPADASQRTAQQAGRMVPPYVSQAAPQPVAAGVVPPPAAPVYSTRPPGPVTRFELEAESSAARGDETQRSASDAAHRKLRVAMQQGGAEDSPTNGVARAAAQAARRPPRPAPRPSFDPVRAAQAGLLNLAWSWQQAGAPIRAIHTYMQVLSRYPDTPAAAAAVADLVELSRILAREGQFHLALAIYEELEQLT